MFEYKIHTQRDKTFSGAFEPTEFEAARAHHGRRGHIGLAGARRLAVGLSTRTGGLRLVVPGTIQDSIQEIQAHWTDWAALDGLRRGRNRTSEHWSTPAGREEEFS